MTPAMTRKFKSFHTKLTQPGPSCPPSPPPPEAYAKVNGKIQQSRGNRPMKIFRLNRDRAPINSELIGALSLFNPIARSLLIGYSFQGPFPQSRRTASE